MRMIVFVSGRVLPVLLSLYLLCKDLPAFSQTTTKQKADPQPKPWIAEPIYLNAFMFTDGMAPVLGGNNKWGYINMTGKQAIPFVYDYAGHFSEGVAAVSKKANEWLLINKQGLPISPIVFKKDPSKCNNGLIAVCVNDKWGYMNKTGKMVIPATYFKAVAFSEGLAAVWTNDSTCSFINTAGKVIIPSLINPSYKYETAFQGGFVSVGKAGGYYLLDKTGKKITPPADKSWRFVPFNPIVFVEGLLIVQDPKTELRGAIDTAGNLVVPTKFKELKNFSDGWALFNNNGKWSYIDKKGTIVFNSGFAISQSFKNGFAAVAEKSTGNWKWYFVNKHGLVIPGAVFDDIINWDNDVALVKLGGGKGFINMRILEGDRDKKPEKQIAKDEPAKAPELKMFRDKNGLYGFQDINNGFKVVIPAEYKFVGRFAEGLAPVTKDGDKWGYIDQSGKLVIAYRFVSAKEFSNGKALVEEGDLMESVKFYIDRSGKKL